MTVCVIGRIRKLRRPKGKLLLGIVALELAAMPVAAHMMTDASDHHGGSVIVAEVPDRPAGQSVFLVAADSAFVIDAQNADGDVYVDIVQSGDFGNMAFGDATQTPGPMSTCTRAERIATRVYASDRGTVRDEGPIEDQAVMVIVNYAPDTYPLIEILPLRSGYALPGQTCSQEFA